MTLAQAIKQQILVNLERSSRTASSKVISRRPWEGPLSNPPTAGYPFALVGMPRVANDMEDNANNLRTYRFDILFVVNYENMPDMTSPSRA